MSTPTTSKPALAYPRLAPPARQHKSKSLFVIRYNWIVSLSGYMPSQRRLHISRRVRIEPITHQRLAEPKMNQDANLAVLALVDQAVVDRNRDDAAQRLDGNEDHIARLDLQP